ncbi:MAG TPA: iron ABC transporter permease [Caulobacteraceae bacterium]|nr:iron ABC transporter permease [Caulobacteraceae bacterium]
MRLIGGLAVALALALLLSLLVGEAPLNLAQIGGAFSHPGSPPGEVIFQLRAPRALAAALVGAALGLSGAALQGLLRNPLADPAVLGVSSVSALGAAVAIACGLAAAPFVVEGAALGGALLAGAIVTALALRLAEPQSLILFGVALSAAGGAATALVFNLSPSPVATSEVLSWLMGSVANRSWGDLGAAVAPLVIGATLCLASARGLAMLTLGEEAAATSGLPMTRLRAFAVAGAAILTGASVAMAGVVGFVGLAAPHLVRRAADEDPARALAPSALAGAALVVAADLAARVVPTAEELRLGVVTGLFGAPLFALVAWRAGRSWRG